MRGAIQYFLFSGVAWFVAGAIFLTALVCDLARWKRAERPIRLALVLALGLALLSGTALPWWLAIPLALGTLGYLFISGRRIVPAIVTVAVLVCAGLVYEGFFFFPRPIRNLEPRKMVVIGDSLSSGGFGEEMPWPEIVARRTGLALENFSQPAETVSSALEYQAPRFQGADLIIIELGGNDMLGGTAASQFATDLDKLLTLARRRADEVVMFELPILPGKWSFGAHQRRLTLQHDVALIPKRVLARILTVEENVTDDALHLSARGQEQMAHEVSYWLGLSSSKRIADP